MPDITVQKFSRCQAPLAPVLTQALTFKQQNLPKTRAKFYLLHKYEDYKAYFESRRFDRKEFHHGAALRTISVLFTVRTTRIKIHFEFYWVNFTSNPWFHRATSCQTHLCVETEGLYLSTEIQNKVIIVWPGVFILLEPK